MEIEKPKATYSDLVMWYKMKENLAKLKSQESLLRNRIFKTFFPNPNEGINNYKLTDGSGSILKATYVINRKVDEAVYAKLITEFHKRDINPSEFLVWKPELVLRSYKALPEQKRLFFDQCLTIKPGSPQVKIVTPKGKGK